jgi:O-antigen/teichoic acid export membrane protein
MVRRNILANTLGRGWATILGVAVLPLYLRLLGAEAYGLVGLYGTIAVVCSLFDAGISTSLGREVARIRTEASPGQKLAELVRTAEVIYVSIGVLVGCLIAAAAPAIATHWLNLKELKPAEATGAVRLMGAYFALQWPIGLYGAGLQGLQRQVEQNVVNTAGSTVRSLGTVAVLLLGPATITTFYAWQVVATFGFLVAIRETLWRTGEISRRDAAFRWSVTQRVRGFAAGVSVISLVSVVSSQLDKVILTRLVPLKAFGYYSFAVSVAGATTFFAQPVLAATFPALIEAHAISDDVRLSSLFRRGTQLVAVAIFAPAAVVAFFAPIILRLWARDPATAENAAPLLSACMVGSALTGVTVMPFNLTLAVGHVRPAVIVGVVAIVVQGAVLAALAPSIGVISGALGLALVALISLFIYAYFGVRPILPGKTMTWLRSDIAPPFVAACVVAGGLRALSPSRGPALLLLSEIGVASVATLLCAALSSATGRQEIGARLRLLAEARRAVQ